MTQLHPDLNVEINPIFNWYGEQEITDNQGEIFRVWIRLVGESDFNQARVFALRKVYELKLRLKDETSDDYAAIMVSLIDLDRDQLYNAVVYSKFQELVRDASKIVKIKYPKEPSGDADIEKQSEYQHDLDTWNDKLSDAIQNYVNPRYDKLKLDYQNKTYDELYSEYLKYIKNQMCELEFQNNFIAKCVYFGTFKDEGMKQKFFDTFEEFENLRTDVKQQFIAFYKDLEVSSEELKK